MWIGCIFGYSLLMYSFLNFVMYCRDLSPHYNSSHLVRFPQYWQLEGLKKLEMKVACREYDVYLSRKGWNKLQASSLSGVIINLIWTCATDLCFHRDQNVQACSLLSTLSSYAPPKSNHKNDTCMMFLYSTYHILI